MISITFSFECIVCFELWSCVPCLTLLTSDIPIFFPNKVQNWVWFLLLSIFPKPHPLLYWMLYCFEISWAKQIYPSLWNSTSGKTVVYQHHVARVSSRMQCEWASVLVLLNALFFPGVSWAQTPFLSVFWSSTLSTEVLFRADLQLLIKILTAVSILCFGGGSPICVTVSLLSLNRYIKYQFWVM